MASKMTPEDAAKFAEEHLRGLEKSNELWRKSNSELVLDAALAGWHSRDEEVASLRVELVKKDRQRSMFERRLEKLETEMSLTHTAKLAKDNDELRKTLCKPITLTGEQVQDILAAAINCPMDTKPEAHKKQFEAILNEQL